MAIGVTSQPKDKDLTYIASTLQGTSTGVLKKTSTDSWALDANLYAIGNISAPDGKFIVGTVGGWTSATISSAALSLLDDIDVATMRVTLGTLSVSGGTLSGSLISTSSWDATSGAGQLYLNGATGNRIDFNTNGIAAPTLTTRSIGTKIVLYPLVDSANVDYAIGVDSGTLWQSVSGNSSAFKWYGGTTKMMELTNSRLSVNAVQDTATLGTELVTNGTFTTDLSGWTAGANWAYSSGTAAHTSGSAATLTQTISGLTVGSYYQLSYTIAVSAGSISSSLGTSAGGIGAHSTAGNKATSFKAATTSEVLTFTPTSTFVGSIDNVSLKLISANPNIVLSVNNTVGTSAVAIRSAANGSYNTFVGSSSGSYCTTGTYNTAFGYNAQAYNATGYCNTGIGFGSQAALISGEYNTAVGVNSQYYITSGGRNTAVGVGAQFSLTSGSYNNAVGNNAHYALTTGSYNDAFGINAQYYITTGNLNSSFGYASLAGITTGSYNVGLGYNAGYYIANGVTGNNTGNTSIFIGGATKALADGQDNQIVIGYNATGLGSNTTVIGNSSTTITSLKGSVGVGLDTPSANIHSLDTTEQLRLGYDATKYSSFTVDSGGILTIDPTGGTTYIQGSASTDAPTLGAELLTGGTWTSAGWTGDNSVGWTHTAGNTSPLSYSATVMVGNLYQITIIRSGTQTGTCTYIVGGSDSATIAAANSTYTYCPLTKTTAGIIITPSSDFVGTLVVSLKLFTSGSAPVLSLKSSNGNLSKIEMRTTGNDSDANVYIGRLSGYVNTTGTENTGIGYYALSLNTNGVFNTAIGSQALRYNTSSQNTAVGTLSLSTNTTGFSNSALGERALYGNTTGYWNTGLGCRSLMSNTTGFYNTGVGGQALGSNTTGSNSVAVGLNALYGNTTGYNNVAVGASAGFYIANGSTYNTTSSNSIFIGYGTKALADSQTNQIVIGYNMTGLGSNTTVIGNASTTITSLKGSVGVGTDAPSAKIHSVDTAEQLRIGYDATHYASFTSASDGNLSINPSGGNTTIYGSVSTAGTTHLGTGSPSSLYVGYNAVNGDLPASTRGSRFYVGFVANQSEFASNYGHLFGTWDANGSSGTTPGYAYQLFKPYNGAYLQYRHGLSGPNRWSSWETIITSGQNPAAFSNGVTATSFTGALNGTLGATTPNTIAATTGSFSGTISLTKTWDATTGASSLYLNGTTGNRIDFNAAGYAAPAFTTRSIGTKIVLCPAISGSTVDYAIGIESGTLWQSVPASNTFKWYGGITEQMTLSAGSLGINATSPAARVHSISTTEQLRLGYDATKYASFTVDAVGNLTTTSTIGVSNSSATATTTSTTQTVLASFAVASYISGEYLIQAVQGTIRQITKLLVIHDGTTAYATEYGTVTTNSRIFNVNVDISGGNVRLLVTTTSATSTVYKTSFTLL